jgi:hypothetical protein
MIVKIINNKKEVKNMNKELVYKITGKPTVEKLNEYSCDDNMFFRFQNPLREIGEESWGMIYKTKEEAIEDGCTILNGKSCCWNATDFAEYLPYYNNSYVIMIVKGFYVKDGHDEEPVVDISKIVEVWDYDDFVATYEKYYEMMIEYIN